ncbi:MAG TPA: iron ABC transporter permease [Candidatus Korarchaeota archaeon]|nr:iron ABC transporter permease [Candidatus Korarchaeota archaeon]
MSMKRFTFAKLGLVSVVIMLVLWGASSLGLFLHGIPYLPQAIADKAIRRALKFSFAQAFVSALLSVILAIPPAYLDATYDFKGRKLLKTMVTMPFTLPTISVALSFLLLSRTGIFPGGWPSIIAAHVYFNYGMCSQIISASLSSISTDVEEAADTLGASYWLKMRAIVLPLLTKGITYSFTLTFVLCFTSFAIPLLLGGPRYRTLEVEIYSLYKVFLDEKLASGAAIIQLAVTSILSIIALRSLPAARSKEVRVRRGLPKDPFHATLLVYYIIMAFTTLYPVAYLLYRSLFNPLTDEFSPGVYIKIFSRGFDPSLGTSPLNSLINSLFFAAMTSISTLLVASLLISSTPRIKDLGMLISLFPLGTSSISLALGLYALGSKLQIPGWVLITSSHFLISAPFTFRSLEAGASSIDPTFMDAAETLGLDRLDATFKVLLPLILPSVLVGSFYAFVMSISETSAVALLSTPETQTLTVAALRYSGVRRFQEATAISVLVCLMTWALLVLHSLVERKMKWIRR